MGSVCRGLEIRTNISSIATECEPHWLTTFLGMVDQLVLWSLGKVYTEHESFNNMGVQSKLGLKFETLQFVRVANLQ